ncbi:GrpB family protein [Shewanella canadensis]|uniref:GrpB family protein n=1 Tax=Shewanella canadensis TaxID=271096 RepID=A0A431WW60_9GAMM|nr:GrpB family protein [Shewanella canadensis]RTR39680.1 GrpB family protein [Shewanella canadensis]
MSNRVLEVVDYDPNWKKTFETERALLTKAIGINAVKIEHIGSTSVIGLAAKPVIDILIEVTKLKELDTANENLKALGYNIKGENGISGRRYFHKGGNQRTHHVHTFQTNDLHLHRHRAFKEYLIAHPTIATEYAAIKKQAVSKSGNNINVYMVLKNDFIQKHEILALQWFGN